MLKVAKSVVSKVAGAALISMVLAASVSTGHAAYSKQNSQVGVKKLAALQVAAMESDRLTSNHSNQLMQSETCLQTGGEPMPYRMSASSLSGENGFQVLDASRTKQIGYEVVWSDRGEEIRLSDSRDMTDVLQAEAFNGCDNHMLSIEWDQMTYDAAAGGAYTDTLSLMFVIE